MTHILKRDDFVLYFLLRQFLTRDVLVLKVIRTIQASVHAVIRKIKRREQHDTVAVKCLLDLLSDLKYPLILFRNIAGQEHRSLPVRKPLTCAAIPVLVLDRARLLEYLIDKLDIVLVRLGIFQSGAYLGVIYKFIRN
jgi:hypothetical protein